MDKMSYEEELRETAKNLEEIEKKPKIEPLPISEEKYIACLQVLAKKAIDNNDQKACQEYFELKRRAIFGNHYYA